MNVAAAAESGTGETLVVGCVDTGRPVSTIVEELFARKAIKHVGGYQLRLAENGAILDGGSKIGEVLKDGDYVTVGTYACAYMYTLITLDFSFFEGCDH